MNGSKSIQQRLFLIENLDQIIFNSEWTKKQFLFNLPKIYIKIEKLSVIYQSTTKTKIDLKKKQNIITFIGKLNKAKGYDVFGDASIKILNEFPNWKVEVIGDESREKIYYHHNRFNLNGFQKHKNVLKILKKASISVVCSRWDEPFGRTSLESSSHGCATIISNKGGLPETTSDALILNKINSTNLYILIKKLITNTKLRSNLQKNSIKNFYLTHNFVSKLIDDIREKL
jgi:glycosyltransferase involved in cell wall biosynthesis